MLWLVEASVYLKSGVLDAPGQVVSDALHKLGFEEVRGVRMGKAVRLEMDVLDETAARQRVQEMGAKLLANPVVETFEIKSIEAPTPV